jgi:hypothetical protein
MRSRRLGFVLGLASLLLLATVVSGASDPPDSAVNPVSEAIETADTSWDGSQYEVRRVVDPGDGGPSQITVLTSNAVDDREPRLAISDAGDTSVVWWRDETVDAIVLRRFDYASQTWGVEETLSEPGESSRAPNITFDGTQFWVAYELDTAAGTRGIAVTGGDAPEPWPTRTILSTTMFAGDLAVAVHAEQDNLWVTWTDSTTHVGWSEYDYQGEVWSAPSFESYANDSIEDALDRVRTNVLEN